MVAVGCCLPLDTIRPMPTHLDPIFSNQAQLGTQPLRMLVSDRRYIVSDRQANELRIIDSNKE